jgi:PDZ domain
MTKEEQNIENDPVSVMLTGMKRVEPPGDFDFRVKARIASGRYPERKASWFPASIRIAAPAGLLLLAGGYFGFHSLYPANSAISSSASVIPVVETAPIGTAAPANQTVALSQNEVVANRTGTKPLDDTKINTAATVKKNPSSGSSALPPGGGSYEEARRTPRQVDTDPIEPNHKLRPPHLAAKDIISQIGANANYSSSIWTVGSVKQNSRAERSGLKAGDVIEAINGKSARIRRDGKAVQIDLKP